MPTNVDPLTYKFTESPFYVLPNNPLSTEASVNQCVQCITCGNGRLKGMRDDFRQLAYLTINDNRQRLAKPPFPLTLENVSETPTYAPQDVPMLIEVSPTRDSLETEEIPVETQQNEEYKLGRHMDDFDQFLASLNMELSKWRLQNEIFSNHAHHRRFAHQFFLFLELQRKNAGSLNT